MIFPPGTSGTVASILWCEKAPVEICSLHASLFPRCERICGKSSRRWSNGGGHVSDLARGKRPGEVPGLHCRSLGRHGGARRRASDTGGTGRRSCGSLELQGGKM